MGRFRGIYPRQHSIHYLLGPMELHNDQRISTPSRLCACALCSSLQSRLLSLLGTGSAPFFEHIVHVEHFAIVARMPLPRLR